MARCGFFHWVYPPILSTNNKWKLSTDYIYLCASVCVWGWWLSILKFKRHRKRKILFAWPKVINQFDRMAEIYILKERLIIEETLSELGLPLLNFFFDPLNFIVFACIPLEIIKVIRTFCRCIMMKWTRNNLWGRLESF